MTSKNNFSQLLKEGYRFNIGEHLSNGWSLFSKGAGSFIGFILLFFIMYFAVAFITVSIWPPLAFGIWLLITPLFAGLFVFLRQLTKGEHEFGDFFRGFQQFGQITLLLFTMILITSPLLIFYFGYIWPWEIYVDLFTGAIDQEAATRDLAFHMQDNLEGLGLYMIISYIVSIYIGVSYCFALPLIVDAKMGFWQAMETSRKVAAKKFFSIFALFLVMGLLSIAGFFITCGIGMLVIMPYFYCVIFSAYDGIFTSHIQNFEGQIDSFGTGNDDVNTES